MTPNDPLYANQWHLRMLGNIEAIWNDYTGLGIHVGVYDSGVDYRHSDLRTRYDASRHVVIDGRTHIPDPDDSPGNENTWHGTGAAGLIAATGNNRTGGVGVSWGASLTGVNILGKSLPTYLNEPDPVGFLSAVHQMTRFDVTNGSWNATPGYAGTFQNLNNPNAFAARLAAEYAHVSANGRGGLGTVIVQSAGNDDLDVNGNGTNVTRHNITVAAANQDGFVSSYSNYGSSVLLTAPGSETAGSIVTTDRSGSAGRTGGDYMDNYNGTSAAAPIVSGAVALMLQANPGLGWRDVQTILALSSTHTGTRIGASQHSQGENNFWQVNGADTWNGGGMHVSNDYGYGMLNVYNAVRMAEAWKHVSPVAQTSANEVRFSTGNLTVNGNTHIPDGRFLNVSFNVTASMILEHVDLTLTFRHGNFNFVNIYAYSPEGTRILLHDGRTGAWNAAANGLTWTFGIDSLRGEASAGTWTIQFVDTFAETADGFFTNVEFVAYGTRPTVDDVYHYTDELVAMSALNAARLSLNDTDGGIDWIDAAAVTGNCFVNLASGGKTTIAGKEIAMGGGVIECAVTGDGNDVLVANSARNTLVGGRGNDTYLLDSAADVVIERSGQGADTIIASVSYRLAARQSVETLLAANKTGTATIDLTGNELANALQGTNGANRLDGGLGADTMTGLGGNDVYVIDNAGDRAVETGGTAGGIDTVLASIGLTLADSLENLTLTGSAALNGTGNALANTLTGNAAANVLNGLGGADTMIGGASSDTYYVDVSGDRVLEAVGGGTDIVLTSVSYALIAGQEIETLRTNNAAATTAVNLFGNEFANSISGNAGANILRGGLGRDVLDGKNGFDTADYRDKTASVSVTLNAAIAVSVSVGGTIEDTIVNIESLIGGSAADTLTGDALANTLNGGGGGDTLTGRAGNDTYYVDSAGDRVFEAAGGGTDTVLTSISYALIAGQEIEALQTTDAAATTAINLTGNAVAQTLRGNAGTNVLNGGGGADTMIGGAGNDTYYVDSAGDQIVEAAGAAGGLGDVVRSSVNYGLAAGVAVERLETTSAAGTASLVLAGNSLGQTIVGNAGANSLFGNGGADTLIGGGGNDSFVFTAAPGAGNVATILDFGQASGDADLIRLENAIFTGLGAATGLLNAALFKANTAGVATEADDRIVYETDTGKLFYDADGSGAGTALQVALLSNKTVLTVADIFVV